MIPARTLIEAFGPKTPIYTWISPCGENINIASGLLRDCCLRYRPEIILTHIDHELAHSFIRDNIISSYRVEQLKRRYTHEGVEPVLFCEHLAGDPDAFLVDGHHRYYIASLYGHDLIRAWLIPEAAWHPFRISGLDDLTSKQLSALPINPRLY